MIINNIIIYIAILFVTLGIFGFIFFIFDFIYNKNKRNRNIIEQRNNSNEQYLNQIQKEINDLLIKKEKLTKEISEQRDKINQIYQDEKNKISEQIEIYKNNINYASHQYIETLEQQYSQVEQKYFEQIENFKNQEKEYKDKIQEYISEVEELKNTLNAGLMAQLREREKEENLQFYKLSLNSIELEDIIKLNTIKLALNQPVILSKLIWSTYFQKQATELCNRVFGVNPICGIYKITNIKNEQCYIGQSVNIQERIKQHIKCGLGIDAPTTNKLYNAMQNEGVWNYTFELLEQCNRTELDKKEKQWIEMYKAREFGYNATKGNNK